MNEMTGKTLLDAVDALIDRHHLLTHPFYQAWTKGTLSRKALQHYAAQYYRHVAAFPDHLRSLAERTEGPVREMVLENLRDEENPEAPHPMLWRQFAHAVGVSDQDMDTAEPADGIRALNDTYRRIAREASAPAAIAAFYAYEAQIPEIAAEKIKGLKDHYGVEDREGLAYFGVHEKTDRVHRAQWRRALMEQPLDNPEEILTTVVEGLKSLWAALDSCHIDQKTVH